MDTDFIRINTQTQSSERKKSSKIIFIVQNQKEEKQKF